MFKAVQIQQTDKDLEKSLMFAHNAGFTDISIGCGSNAFFNDDNWEEEVYKIKGYLDKYNLNCVQTHLPYYHLLISSEVIDEKMEIAVERCIKASGIWGAKWTAMHLRSSIINDYSKDASFRDNASYLEKYLKICEESKVGIAVENLPVFPSMLGCYFYSCHPDDLIRIVDYFKSDYLGICWDTGHANLTRLNQPKSINDIGERLKITHIHNNFSNDDHHLPPFIGHIKWDEIMKAFKNINYQGPLTLEVVYDYNKSIEEFLRYSYLNLVEMEELI